MTNAYGDSLSEKDKDAPIIATESNVSWTFAFISEILKSLEKALAVMHFTLNQGWRTYLLSRATLSDTAE